MNDRTIPNLRMSLTNHLVLSGPEERERDLLASRDEVEQLRNKVHELHCSYDTIEDELATVTEDAERLNECCLIKGRCKHGEAGFC